MKLPKFKSDEEEADFWDRFDTTQIIEEGEEVELEYEPEEVVAEDICSQCGEDTEVYKDEEGYFVRLPVEIVESLDAQEKKRTKIGCLGKRIILEIG